MVCCPVLCSVVFYSLAGHSLNRKSSVVDVVQSRLFCSRQVGYLVFVSLMFVASWRTTLAVPI